MERPASIINPPPTTTEIVGRILSEEDPDPVALAFALKYKPAAIAKLREKHGDHLLRHLKAQWRARQEQPRFLAKQQGRYVHANTPDQGQYVDAAHRSIDDLEAVADEWLERFADDRDQRKAQRAAKVLARLEESKEALVSDLADPDFKHFLGQDGWVLLSKHERAIRNVRRRAA